jgi:hypothetical protein
VYRHYKNVVGSKTTNNKHVSLSILVAQWILHRPSEAKLVVEVQRLLDNKHWL